MLYQKGFSFRVFNELSLPLIPFEARSLIKDDTHIISTWWQFNGIDRHIDGVGDETKHG